MEIYEVLKQYIPYYHCYWPKSHTTLIQHCQKIECSRDEYIQERSLNAAIGELKEIPNMCTDVIDLIMEFTTQPCQSY